MMIKGKQRMSTISLNKNIFCVVGQVGICRQFGVPEKCAHYDILPRE